MEIRSSVKLLNFVRKLLLGETDAILPYPVTPQKPQRTGKKPTPLPRISPADAGVSAMALDTLYRTLATAKNGGVHSCIVVRHGKVVSEGFYAPYSAERWHVTHSLCKSFTGTAIGMLMDEGLLTQDEAVSSIFPEKCNLLTGRRSKAITVYQLLTMQSGVLFKEAGIVLDSDWVKAFFDADVAFEPGTQFDYNSMNSYLLSAIVKRKTGLGLMDYLTPRLFEPLQFGDIAWEVGPNGIEKGGWGMYVYLEDAIKLGLLYLQNGKWNADGSEKQLLSEAYIADATRTHAQRADGEEYGYQIWTNSKNGQFMFNGMFGQYVLVAPQQDMIVAVNAGAANLFTKSESARAIHTFLNTCLVADDSAADFGANAMKQLDFTLSHLQFGDAVPALPPPQKWYQKLWEALALRPQKAAPALLPKTEFLSDKPYLFAENRAGILPVIVSCMECWFPAGITEMLFIRTDDTLELSITESGAVQRFPIGFDTFATGELNIGGNRFAIGTRGKFTTDEDDHPVLKVTMCLLESSCTRLFKFIFMENGALIVKMDEAPAVSLVIEMLEPHTGTSALRLDSFKDLGYFKYKLDAFCAPTLTALPDDTPVADAKPEHSV
ncbi:MAG: serine hydrolase [Ruthenibacterium sp.]